MSSAPIIPFHGHLIHRRRIRNKQEHTSNTAATAVMIKPWSWLLTALLTWMVVFGTAAISMQLSSKEQILVEEGTLTGSIGALTGVSQAR